MTTSGIQRTSTSKHRLDWVDIAKGLSIFLVVMYHATLGVGDELGAPGFMHYVLAFATPFRMPEFFLISGLFLSMVIARPWPQYADRRVIHYLYFYLLWAAIQIVFKVGLGAGDPATAGSYLLWAIIQPYGVLWFIYMLAVFGAITKLLWQFKVPHLPVLAIAAVLQMLPIDSPSFAITQFAEYFIYFYAGYVFAPLIFKAMEWVQSNILLGWMALLVWASINLALVFSPGFAMNPDHIELGIAGWPGVRLLLAITGSLAVCTLAVLLAELRFAKLIRWVGANSIVIYLSFVIPMAVGRTILVKTGLISDPGWMSLTVIIIAMVSPLVLYALIKRIGWGKFLFERPDWAKLPSMRNSIEKNGTAKSKLATPAE